MIGFLSKYRKPIFIATVVTFLLGIFVFFGLGSSSSYGSIGEVRGKELSDKIFSLQANNMTSNLRDNGLEITEALRKGIYQQVFQNMVVDEIFHQEAEKIGLIVTDFEVAAEIQSTPAFLDGGKFNPRAYVQAISSEFGMAPSEYEEWRKYQRLVSKYREFLMTNIKVTQDEAAAYLFASGVKLDSDDKNKSAIISELIKAKYTAIGNYMLRQAVKDGQVKSYIEKRYNML